MPFKKSNMFVKDINIKEDEILTKGIVEIYKEILRGDKKQFPSGTWVRPDSLENAKKCIKYLIENKLKFTDEEIKNKICSTFFREYKLAGMLYTCFNNSPYNAINIIYPNRFKPWEFVLVTRNYWKSEENCIAAIKWLVEEKLHLSDEELKNKLSFDLFVDNNLKGMLTCCFNNSPFAAINLAYPNKFKPWEFSICPKRYWTKETSIEAIKWLVEEKLNLSDDELKENLSNRLFIDNGLGGMINIVYNYSPFAAINSAYPNKFKKEDFKIYCK